MRRRCRSKKLPPEFTLERAKAPMSASTRSWWAIHTRLGDPVPSPVLGIATHQPAQFFLGRKRGPWGEMPEKIRRDLINAAALARRRNGILNGGTVSNSLSLGRPETFGALAEQFQKVGAVGVVGVAGFALVPVSRNVVPASGPINAQWPRHGVKLERRSRKRSTINVAY